jgi:hypothetical protein
MVRIDLQSVIPTAKPGLERYVEKVILWGGSAEATFAVQPEFVEPDGFIKAVIATYSGLAIEANREKSFVEAWIIPTRFQSHSVKMKPGKVVRSAGPLSRMETAFLRVQQVRIRQIFGQEDRLCL